MMYSTTEPASKVKLETFQGGTKHTWENTSNKAIVPIVDSVPSQYKEVISKFEDALNLFNHVVPSACLVQIQNDLNSQAAKLDTVKQDMQDADVAKPEVVKVLDTLKNETLQLLVKVHNMKDSYELDVSKETQRNDFFINY